ncbi:MAG: DUF2961 domain-containing protein [Candidatus Sumerlaeaceae bacterium]|nr:DUF2961 domain-containing protein [Candidatus Sumerlaeaceae bacterium]
MLSNDILMSLPAARAYRSRRESSYDRSGGNNDFIKIPAGARATLADIKGAGIVKHIWFTIYSPDELYPSKLVLRAWWDGEDSPSIECPVGDFFGVGHGKTSNFMSLPLNMVNGGEIAKQNRAAMNCFFPMPFRKGARFEIENQTDQEVISFYYYIDYEEHDSLPDDTLYFHAQWHRENPTKGYEIFTIEPHQHHNEKLNVTGNENYVLLDAEGRGHYVGCVVNIKNVNYNDNTHTWFGEGDDMIFVDDEKWPPALHGTGTEDYFCAAWGFPSGKYDGPFHGISLAGDTTDWSGCWSLYRFHLESPVTFQKSIRVTIEHGHDNNRFDDWSSVAYWYQGEPHKVFPALLPVEKRLPRWKRHWEKP